MLAEFRADPLVASFRGAIDAKADSNQLEQIATRIPDEWLVSAANGDPEHCVAAVRNQLTLGADGVILHGATPDEPAPILAAY